MSYNVVANNLLAMNAERMLGINNKSKEKNMEKLASGYRINRAADDAAGLAVSEKMRRMIRGLNQGTENAHDGVSWVQTGDGALEEVDTMLHRMTELTVKSLNGTWTDSDRAMMQAEFQQLQKEIDRLTDAATFNEKHIFAEHELPYYQYTGNISWLPSQKHNIMDGSNSLTITYTRGDGTPTQSATITVPPGQYTTKELMDEIDTALEKAGLKDEGFSFEFTEFNTCNLNYDGGVYINSVDGGLSYLLYDVFEGGSAGALIGTTKFLRDDATLEIVEGVNDHMEFDIERLDGTSEHLELTIPPKTEKPYGYTRDELIEILNEKLADTSVRAVKYGQGIKLESDDSIITALKGNMFKVDYIDRDGGIYTSVFYDNIGYGGVSPYPGKFIGGAVLVADPAKDEEHHYYNITSLNNRLFVQPNGSPDSVELVIDPGYYSADDMVDKLNKLFEEKGLGLTADKYVENGYEGLIITSDEAGLDSNVGIDSSSKSSAYNTLFIRRTYNVEEEAAAFIADKTDDKNAAYKGGKVFASGDFPFTVNRGINDKFNIILDGKTYEITVAGGVYDTIGALTNAINSAITEAANKLSDTTEASLLKGVSASNTGTSSAITLTANNGVTTSIVATKSGENTGFEEIFTTSIAYEVSESSTSKDGRTTCNTEIDFPATITSGTRTLYVYVTEPSGAKYTYTVDIPPGEYENEEDLLKVINEKLPKAETEKIGYSFTTVNVSGSGGSYSTSGTLGSITPSSKTKLEAQGAGDVQGSTGGNITPTAATDTIPVSATFPYEITSSNNTFTIRINTETKTITLPTGPCASKADLIEKLKNALDSAFVGGAGVDVKDAGSNGISLTTRRVGTGAYIYADFSGSPFLKDVSTSKEVAAASIPLNSSFEIKAGVNDKFSFNYIVNGKSQAIDITIPAGNYNSSNFSIIENAINDQLSAKNIDITAKISSGSLRLTANTPGSGQITYNSASGGSSAEEMVYGVKKTQAEKTIDRDIKQTIEIDGNSNEFKLSVNDANGNRIPYTAYIKPGTYDRDGFIAALNTALGDAGARVRATLEGNQIKLTSIDSGRYAGIYMTHNGGGSSMDAIFGTYDSSHDGLEASFDEKGRLVLTAKKEDGSTATADTVRVTSTYGSIFQRGTITSSASKSGTATIGYHSKVPSILDGAKLSEPVSINRWNSDFNFTYYEDGRPYRMINIQLDYPANYTFDELKDALQHKLDMELSGKFDVNVTADGVKITCKTPGNTNYIDKQSCSGGFYKNVLCRAGQKAQNVTAVNVKGGYDSTVYAVGRKDIRHNTTTITKGVNDALSLYFTYGDTEVKLEMTLDPGKYNSGELVKQVQKKLNEQLVAHGLNPNLIEVQIGGINTGVEGNNDNNSLVFRLSEHVELPDENAEYKIDGIGGTAAFSIFYQTDGDIMVAYISGTKDVSKGVTIPADSELSFDVDGEHYSITVPKGNYSPQGILDKLNELLKAAGAPLTAKISDNVLQLSLTKYGTHKITNVSGPARQYLFFNEEGAIEGEKDIWLRVGSESGDGVTIERPVVNTVSLGLNSLVITKPKYAEKALNRIKTALTKVSEVRTNFGVKQNRLEHTINKNNNTSENMQAAESAIRDADISKEMMEFAINNILENAGVSMLTQANSSKSYLLSLLQ